jgi:long-chain acyl-CoA synthetase
MCLHMACYRAAHLVILPRYRPDWALQAIAEHRVTLISGAPRIYQSLLAYEGIEQADFSSLRFCYSGAAPLAEVILQRWEQVTGAPLLEGYGMTEAGPVLTYNPVQGLRKVGSVGCPVPWSSLEIVDPEQRDRVLPADSEGEIRVRGPHVMAGYRNRPAETAHALAGGWLYTGDIGRVDADGYLFITGRKGERLNVGGFKVYPSEVDHVLLGHPAVAEAAAFGVADSRYGQVVHACVVLRPQAVFDEAALIAHCREHLVDYKVPHIIRPLDAMPTTGAGKLARQQLAAIVDEESTGPRCTGRSAYNES